MEEKIMRFISVDGVVFDDQDACKRHEDAFLQDVEMMEGDGKSAIHMDGAVVVLLKNARASLMFTNACESVSSPCDGVEDREGLFVWDMDEERYFRIDPTYAEGTIKGCYRLLEEEDKKKKAEEERAQRERDLREIVGAEDNE